MTAARTITPPARVANVADAEASLRAARERRRRFLTPHGGVVARARKALAAVGEPPANDTPAAIRWVAGVVERQARLLAALETQSLAQQAMAHVEAAAAERCRAVDHQRLAVDPDVHACGTCWNRLLDAGEQAIGGRTSIRPAS